MATARGDGDDPSLLDRAWVGYNPRAMAPVVALAAVTSLVLWTGSWFLADLSQLVRRVGGWAVFALAWGVWPAVAGVFLYRTVTFTYRLTDRAVLVDFGPLSRPTEPVRLLDVSAVVVGGWWLGRRFGVGWVEIRAADRALRLRGVRHPALFAERVREAVAAAAGQD